MCFICFLNKYCFFLIFDCFVKLIKIIHVALQLQWRGRMRMRGKERERKRGEREKKREGERKD